MSYFVLAANGSVFDHTPSARRRSHQVTWCRSIRFTSSTGKLNNASTFTPLIDLYSRTAYAEVHDKLRQTMSLDVTLRAQAAMSFKFTTVQADNGSEFQRYFHDILQAKGITLRHSRVRQSNDNAHVERFNRTIQDECLGKYPTRDTSTQAKLDTYLHCYNAERKHMGIGLKRPKDLLAQVLE